MFRILDISGRSVLGCGLMLGLAAFPGGVYAKSKETVLYRFQGGSDGSEPEANLISDKMGNLYGTTSLGGGTGCSNGAGCGTVFRVTPKGKETVLYAFGGHADDGAYPYGAVISDKNGNLYSTTGNGGTKGWGTVFRLTPGGNETVLYSFAGYPSDGAYPYTGVISDKAGNLYGTTYIGGTEDGCGSGVGCGAVFEITSGGKEALLYSFCSAANCADGADPSSGLIMDKSGNLYGTTTNGGYGFGVVFKVTPNGTETVLHSFGGAGDGGDPSGGLIADKSGNFFGTTGYGGAVDAGIVFELAPDGTETILHNFGTTGTDGAIPVGGVVLDASGNLYGTTVYGGGTSCYNGNGCGTVFELAPDGTETVLHAFKGGNHGYHPYAGVILKGPRKLYGTTQLGGGTSCSSGNGSGCGIVFEITTK